MSKLHIFTLTIRYIVTCSNVVLFILYFVLYITYCALYYTFSSKNVSYLHNLVYCFVFVFMFLPHFLLPICNFLPRPFSNLCPPSLSPISFPSSPTFILLLPLPFLLSSSPTPVPVFASSSTFVLLPVSSYFLLLLPLPYSPFSPPLVLISPLLNKIFMNFYDYNNANLSLSLSLSPYE